VLGLDEVGAEASFFDLGGDSIMSMLLVSKARRAGLAVTARQIFEQQTPAGLAAVAGVIQDNAPIGEPGIGDVPLTPVMHELLDRTGPDRIGEAALATLVTTPAGADHALLDQALRALLIHHDILRARLTSDAGGWRLTVPEAAAPGTLVHRVDVSGLEGDDVFRVLEEGAEAAAARIDPHNGVMVRAVWFDAGPERAGRLLLTIAHLVVDTVSLRILLPDLAEAYTALAGGQEVALQPVPISFRHWARALAADDRLAELPTWTAMLREPEPLLTDRPVDPARDTTGSTRRVSVTVPGEVTSALLTSVPAAFAAGIEDVLLTGLAVAVTGWRDGDPAGGVLVDVEGHGRVGDLDLSRTVGWFTSSHPVRLNAGPSHGGDLGDAMKRVKEQLRAVPESGAGFGVLRYLNPATGAELAGLAQAQIGFNYLGRMPGGNAEPGDGGPGAPPGTEPAWQIAAQGVGGTDRDVPVLHPIEVTGVVRDVPGDPQLTLGLAWPEELLTEDAARRLLEAWAAALTGLVAHTERHGGGHTPADFPLAQVTQHEIERYEAAAAADGRVLAEIWPLSPLQEGILFHSLYDEQAMDVYVEQMSFAIEGDLDAGALRAAWQSVLDRHDSLRAGFRARGAGPLQTVLTGVEVPWREEDLSALEGVDAEAEADRIALQEQERRFDLAVPPLLRVLLLTFAPGRYRMVLTLHHILLDGWSLQILVQELGAAYAANTGGAVGEAPPVVSYREYLAWLARQDVEAARDAWRDALSGAEEPTLVAPLDHGAVQTFPGSVVAETGPELDAAIRELASAHGSTVNTVVQAAWAAVLGGLTGRRDVVFGASVAGRPAELPGMESMLGLFINTVPVRVRFDPRQTVAELLTGLQAQQTALLGHQYLSLSEIQRIAGPGALFDTIMAFESFGAGAAGGPPEHDRAREAPGAVLITPEEGREAINYPLALVVGPADGLSIRLTYRTDRYDEAGARAVLDRLLAVLGRMAAEPDLPVRDLAPLDPADHDRVIRTWNETRAPIPDATVPALIAAQAARTPDAPAARCGDEVLTYAQLVGRADGWAAYLADLGAAPEECIALCLPRGVDMIVAMLAVWRTGAAFVPLDHAYPAERLGFIVADSGAALVLGTGETLADLPLGDARPVEWGLMPQAEPPAVDIEPDSLAYVIYTSGSTGIPKGVAVAHRGVANLASVMRPVLGGGVVTLQFASFSFDASILDIAVTLTSGGCLAIASAEERTDPRTLAAMIRDTGVEAASVVPSLLSVLDPAEVPGVRTWVLGAERLSAELAGRWTERATVWNTYGPTEATVISTAVPVPRQPRVAPAVGAPIGNVRAYVLDEFLTPVGPGVPGEVYLAGPGLARGYVGRPGLTSGAFVASPFHEGERMYRSGDLVRWDHEGNLHFEGRGDEQVKIRGFRVEPGEVEAVLAGHEDVSQVAVVQRDSHLVAYVVGSADGESLRELAARRLPEHMVPSAVVTLDALPLTVNGKLNRAALPAPGTAGRAPRTPVEELLCGLFAEVLGVPSVAADRSFFELGGDSLLAMRLMARIRAVFDTDVSLRTLFAGPAVADIARTLDGGDQAEGLLLPLATGGDRPPLFCVHPSLGLASCYADLARHLEGRPVYGLQARGFRDGERMPESIEEMAMDYVSQIRAVQPEGPYHLLGWSFGGLVAHAMATRLRQLGEDVALLAVVDGYPITARRAGDGDRERNEPPPDAAREPGPKDGPRMPTEMMRVNASHISLSERFTPAPFDGDLLLFVAGQESPDSLLIENAPDSWTPFVHGTIRCVNVAAAHHAMLQGHAGAEIGRIISESVRIVQGGQDLSGEGKP
ncbi:amino acid adenylation domain-containing protein, partial [Actinoplanes sp. NPDC049548]|uniref:amino acid adenylation domain-containing protein n=1 Tax=Actinoplanes sp. NPDC049548 TaxID=3155152 RepID=UPI00342B4CFB